MSQESFIDALARAFLAGETGYRAIVERVSHLLGHRWNWVRRIAHNYVAAAVSRKTRPRHRDVAAFIVNDPSFLKAWPKYHAKLAPVSLLTEPQRMQPVAAAASWNLPVIESVGALADWFWLELGQLEWFADLDNLAYKSRAPKLRHYHYRVVDKIAGFRLIEAPKPRIKEMQRQILTEILDHIPAHPAAHGFVKGRSILTFASPHVAQPVVLRLDIKDFFPAIYCERVQAIFRTIGYPESVAGLLGGICTTASPRDVWPHPIPETFLYSRRHLPQGAPTSPSLANLCAFHLDCRLAGLARSAGATYSRYADDLAFSGDTSFARATERFSIHAASIVLDEGFSVQHRKTRIMRQSVRQHLAGIVTNQHPTSPAPISTASKPPFTTASA